jgi:hypothetical protein
MATFIKDESIISCNESNKTALEIIREIKPEIEINNDYDIDKLYSLELASNFSENTLYSIREQLLELANKHGLITDNLPYEVLRLMRYQSRFMEAMEAINGDSWIISKGEYCGTWLKRFNSYLYKNFSLKLSASMLSELGGYIGKVRGEQGSKLYNFDFTDKINWDSGDYGDRGSCFWGGRANAKESIRLNGGIAIRFYSDSSNINSGIARAWLLPYRDSLLLFNSYGLEAIVTARALATFLGFSYARVGFNNSDSDYMLYINSSSGYLIAKQENIPSNKSLDCDYAILADEDVEPCRDCGEYFSSDDLYHVRGYGDICSDCIGEYSYCNYCGEYYENDSGEYIESRDSFICSSCLEDNFTACDNCGEYYDNDRGDLEEVDNQTLCSDCRDDLAEYCNYCGEYHLEENFSDINGFWVCEACSSLELVTCSACGSIVEIDSSISLEVEQEEVIYCSTCFSAMARANRREEARAISFSEFIK